MARSHNRRKVAHGEAVVRALLRTPKTRKGLIAAVKTTGLTQNFVFGFLSVALRNGEVLCLKSGAVDTYQLSSRFSMEQPEPGLWPTWLEPRHLPEIRARRVFLAGRPAEDEIEDQKQEEEETCA